MRHCLLLFALLIAAGHAENPSLEPTLADVSYGPDPAMNLNFWKAESETPTPILVYIHGGGWLGGQKHATMHLHPYLSQGISVASIDYRLAKQAILPVPVMDAARAIQFIRSKAAEWNLDKTRLAVSGGSAGACTSLWLAFHDDLADPASDDAVARESTKPTCAAVTSGQTFVDAPLVLDKIGRPALNHGMIWMTVGAKSPQDALDNHATYKALYDEFSPMYHMDANDPPVFLRYSMNPIDDGIHSAKFGLVLLEKAKEIGFAKCYLIAPGAPEIPYKGESDFLLKLLKPAK